MTTPASRTQAPSGRRNHRAVPSRGELPCAPEDVATTVRRELAAWRLVVDTETGIVLQQRYDVVDAVDDWTEFAVNEPLDTALPFSSGPAPSCPPRQLSPGGLWASRRFPLRVLAGGSRPGRTGRGGIDGHLVGVREGSASVSVRDCPDAPAPTRPTAA